MKEMITVEKEVYDAVLRNSVRVNILEVENQQLKKLLKKCRDYLKDDSPLSMASEITKINKALGEEK